MTYQETLSHIYGLGRFGMKPGLERIRATLRALSDPQDAVRIIHVAGTNGKGSTAAFLDSILRSGGHKTGLFTSPHLIAFPERIRLDGREIFEHEVVSLADRVLTVAPEGTTFFEIVTAMAYLFFAEQGAELAVMEVGMGGRFDATNIASGILSIITPIDLDHAQYLGDTLGLIAREKAGVIKAERPVVSSFQADEAREVIRQQCLELRSPLYQDGHDFSAIWESDGMFYSGMEWRIHALHPGIPGRYQAMNLATAICAAELLNQQEIDLSPENVRTGTEQAFWPGRMELFAGPPRVLLDGAHNPAGAKVLVEGLAEIPRKALILVTGVVGDKDAEGILAPLLPLADSVITVSPSVPRGLGSLELAEQCRELGYRALAAGGIANGLETAFNQAHPEDLILVCGSLFVVGEARARLLSQTFEPFRG
ncbi:MAG: bifunctional folylpolyglutamate synthase/dihydrofolate synthase [Deltaproteobacteria bacterium]|nr:bifunctional folylpolyglutamate synthase/dihydrofolate synthase [Deltaproteobacteria bacterium]TLN03685.1 MAG: bifunctional folylpolyglutamate synthase/dihydrofolate synthase [bacterium]